LISFVVVEQLRVKFIEVVGSGRLAWVADSLVDYVTVFSIDYFLHVLISFLVVFNQHLLLGLDVISLNIALSTFSSRRHATQLGLYASLAQSIRLDAHVLPYDIRELIMLIVCGKRTQVKYGQM